MHTEGERARALVVLGLASDASGADVETAYRRLVRRYHPDRAGTAGSTEQLTAVVHAHRVLRTPAAPPPRATKSSTPAPPVRRRPTAAADAPPIVAGPVRYTPAPLRGTR